MKNEREYNNKTELLYETDGMMTEFEATVITASRDGEKGDYVVLDRTAFFPEGGGQQADTGEIIPEGQTAIGVTDVRTVDGQVRHYIKGSVKEGVKITGKIDGNVRYPRMQSHGAEHLVSGLVHSTYGYDNVGFHMSDRELVIDFDGPLSDEQLRQIEERANRIVFENAPVTVSFPSEEEAKNIPYRSKIDGLENIRLVTIEGYDICACCAPHVNSTGQFGVIKILSSMPHRGGTRVTMIAGMDAYRDYADLHDNNARIVELLSAERGKTAEYVLDLTEKMKSLKEEKVSAMRETARLVTEGALERIGKREPGSEDCEVIFTGSLDPKGMRDLVNECVKVCGGPVCAFCGSDTDGYRYIFGVRKDAAERADLRLLNEKFNRECSGKGGGSEIMVQGTSTAKRINIEMFFSSKA
ncbi:MAG: alanyl-tRNA editing protein [Lachnospiraceae bacterium]|nr:alanyl-tRNA editing protein [Lachnospiraceae bacterium]